MTASLRHLLMRRKGYQRRMKREERIGLLFWNDVRGFMGGDAVDPYEEQEQMQDTEKDDAARHALLRQMTVRTDKSH